MKFSSGGLKLIWEWGDDFKDWNGVVYNGSWCDNLLHLDLSTI